MRCTNNGTSFCLIISKLTLDPSSDTLLSKLIIDRCSCFLSYRVIFNKDMEKIYDTKAGLSSLGSIEKSSLKPQIEPITPFSENKPQVQVVQLIVKLGKFLISVVTYIFVSCTFSFIYIFYLVPLCRRGTTSPQPAFMTVSMTLSNQWSFLSAPGPKIANSFFSPSQSPSSVYSSTSESVFSSPRSVSHLSPNPEGTMVWSKKPKDLKERVRWNERRFSDPFCLPTFPSRRIDKKGAIRSSTRENFEKRDLCGGNNSDPNMVKYRAQVVVTTMTYAFYYQCGMRVPHGLTLSSSYDIMKF